MKTKALLLTALLVFLAGSAGAATLFRIVVEGQGEILTSTAPVTSGSTVFVRLADGTLAAIPANRILSIASMAKSSAASALTRSTRSLATVRLANAAGSSNPISVNGAFRTGLAGSLALSKAGSSPQGVSTRITTALSPGQVIVIGPTGSTTAATGSLAIGNRARTPVGTDTVVVSPPAALAARATSSSRGLADTSLTPSANPTGSSLERQIFRSDLARDTTISTSATGTTAGEIGDFIIGANGFPVPITVAGTSATPQTVIGPNGFPVPITTAQMAPQTVVPSIGPNGFPTFGSPTAVPASQTGLTRGIATIPTAVSTGAAVGLGTQAVGTTVVGTTTAATTTAASPR